MKIFAKVLFVAKNIMINQGKFKTEMLKKIESVNNNIKNITFVQ